MADDSNDGGEMHIEEQAREQTGRREVRVDVDERNMTTSYSNGFRANGSAEEVVLDFGVNIAAAGAGQKNRPDIVFQINQRVIMNYYSAKRLALTLGQIVRRHEEQFGELELDVAKRTRGASQS